MSKSTAELLIVNALQNPNILPDERMKLLGMLARIELARLSKIKHRKRDQLSKAIESITNPPKPKENAPSMGDEAQRAIEDIEKSKEARV